MYIIILIIYLSICYKYGMYNSFLYYLLYNNYVDHVSINGMFSPLLFDLQDLCIVFICIYTIFGKVRRATIYFNLVCLKLVNK